MITDSPDPRIDTILGLVSQLHGAMPAMDGAPNSVGGDALDAIIERLTVLVAQCEDSRLEQERVLARVNDLTETMHAIASRDFTRKAQVSNTGGALDTIAIELNAVSETLKSSTVSRDLLLSITNSLLDSVIITEMSDSVIIADADGRITMINVAACRLLGYHESELLGRPLEGLFDGQPSKDTAALPETEDRVVLLKGGVRLPVSCFRSSLKDDQGEPQGSLYVLQDVSKRKQAEETVRMFQHSIDQASDGVFWLTRDAGFSYVNEQACRSLGYTREELLQLRLWDVDPYYPRERWETTWEQWRQDRQGGSEHLETFHRRKDGGIFPVDISSTHLWVGEQELHVAVARDITERRRIENALRESEARYRALVESQADLISRYRPDTTLTFVNNAYCQFYGKTHEELIGRTLLSMVAPEFRDQVRKEAEDLARNRKTVSGEYLNYAADGKAHWIYWFIQGVLDENDQVVEIQAVGHDVTRLKEIENALRESEERLQLAIRAGNIGIFDRDLVSGQVYLSPKLREILGWAPDESMTTDRSFLQVHPDDLEWVNWILERSLDPAGDGTFHAEHRILLRSGEVLWVRVDILIFFEGEGDARRPVRNIGAVVDITDRKRAEKSLRESEARLRIVVENLPVMVEALDENLNVIAWNKECERVTGYTAPEVIGNPSGWEQRYPDKGRREDVLGKFSEFGGDFRETELRVITKDGAEKVVSWSSVSKRFPVPGWQLWLVGIDVTERRRAETELQQSQEMLQLILDHMPSAVLWKDRNSVCLGGNRRAAMLAGLQNPQDMVGHTDLDFPNTVPENARAYQETDRRVMETDTPEIDYEEMALSPVGEPRWLRTSKVPLHDATGNVIGVLVVINDITERKRVDEALRESEARYRTIVETAQEGIWVIDQDGVTTYANPRMADMLGYSPDEMASRSFFDFMDDVGRAEAQKNLERRRQGITEQHEFRFKHKAGHDVWTNLSTSPIMDAQGQFAAALAMMTDITEHRRQEEALQKSEARLRQAQTIAHIGNWEWILASNELYWSGEVYAIFGMQPQEPGLDVMTFFQAVHPDDAIFIQQAVTESLSGMPYHVEHRIVQPDGQIRWVEQHGQVMSDSHGTPVTMVGTTQDVTERKEAEAAIRQLNEELEQRVAERTAELRTANEEIKQFAYIVSHDLRAPLVNLKGFAGELRSALKVVKKSCDDVLPTLEPKNQQALLQALDEDIPEALRFIESSVSSMDTFTRAVLRLSRLGRSQLELVELEVRSLVERVLASLSYQINQYGIKITVGNLPVITADHVSMEQIFSNLLSNAVAYLVPDRPGEIDIRAEQGVEETMFIIRDNGRGIAQEDMDMVFAPFRRVGKQDVPGEGMGLAYVQALVRRYGGRIWCESEVGLGTTFLFTIPTNLVDAG